MSTIHFSDIRFVADEGHCLRERNHRVSKTRELAHSRSGARESCAATTPVFQLRAVMRVL